MKWCDSCEIEVNGNACPKCGRPSEAWEYVVNVSKEGFFYFEATANNSRATMKHLYHEMAKRFPPRSGFHVSLFGWAVGSPINEGETILTNDPKEA